MPSRLALVPFCGQAMGKGQLVLLLGDHGQCFKRELFTFDLLALLRVHPPPGSMSSLFLFASKMPPVSRSVPYPYSYTTMGLQAKIGPFFALSNKSSEQACGGGCHWVEGGVLSGWISCPSCFKRK